MNEFTSRQKEIVARKLGYDGPMQGFEDFLASDPATSMRYASLSGKFAERMAKGGMVKKYQTGGDVTTSALTTNKDAKEDDALNTGVITGAPKIGEVTKAEVVQTTISPEDMAAATTAAQTAQAAAAGAAAAPSIVSDAVTAEQAAAAKAAGRVTDEVAKMEAAQGVVSKEAQVTAATKEPTTTAVSGLEAAQTQAAQVTGAPTRTVQEAEQVSGTAVDQARIEALMLQQQAAQGVVTPEMTVQGQLNKLLQDFDANNPPPWASATMRVATAKLAARGLGASSMAGQAIIQATLEAATPIAAADAKVFETMGLQNLSNRQQMAVLMAQQRAQFLGQEFDQAFQTRVINAAKISDIANKNFDAQTQIALENARLTNTTNLANLSAKNALVLAEAAAMSQLETQNLSNLQQAAVENARAFLQMDMKNLDNKQQTALFKTQQITAALMQDASLQNAVNITNATNALEADKISAQLKLQADQFNTAEQNKVALANAAAANELARFNAEQEAARERFNAEQATQISIANARIAAEVSLANTAATNAANMLDAKNATELTSIEYAQQSQTYRDMLEMSWKSGEDEKTRITEIAKATITANASTSAASTAANAAAVAKLGGAAVEVVKNWDSVKSVFDDVASWFGGD